MSKPTWAPKWLRDEIRLATRELKQSPQWVRDALKDWKRESTPTPERT